MARPNLVLVSEQMRRISEMLGEELLSWPGVRMHPMFGLRTYYRGAALFAMLPNKRAFERPRSVGYKIAGVWNHLDVESERDIDTALACLKKAWKKASATI